MDVNRINNIFKVNIEYVNGFAVLEKTTLIRYTGSEHDIKIPEGITTIQQRVFWNKEVTHVIVPNTVTVIEDGAFSACKYLKSIVLPDSMERIGPTAFQGCSSLTEINIPTGLTKIDVNTFADCINLQRVVIGHGIKEICTDAFRNCNKLACIKIPSTIEMVSVTAFQDCMGTDVAAYQATYDNHKKQLPNGKFIPVYTVRVPSDQTIMNISIPDKFISSEISSVAFPLGCLPESALLQIFSSKLVDPIEKCRTVKLLLSPDKSTLALSFLQQKPTLHNVRDQQEKSVILNIYKIFGGSCFQLLMLLLMRSKDDCMLRLQSRKKRNEEVSKKSASSKTLEFLSRLANKNVSLVEIANYEDGVGNYFSVIRNGGSSL